MTQIEKDNLAWTNNALLREIVEQLTRIANALNEPNVYGEVGSAALSGAIVRGLKR